MIDLRMLNADFLECDQSVHDLYHEIMVGRSQEMPRKWHSDWLQQHCFEDRQYKIYATGWKYYGGSVEWVLAKVRHGKLAKYYYRRMRPMMLLNAIPYSDWTEEEQEQDAKNWAKITG